MNRIVILAWDERLRSATYLRPTEWDERQAYYRPHTVFSQVVL